MEKDRAEKIIEFLNKWIANEPFVYHDERWMSAEELAKWSEGMKQKDLQVKTNQPAADNRFSTQEHTTTNGRRQDGTSPRKSEGVDHS
jgi:hypothetical protein